MTQTDAPSDLARDFEPASYEAWRKLVEKALKGADFDKRLVTHTADGIAIEPLYSRADTLAGTDTAVPGAAPFTRGTAIEADSHGWQIHQRVGTADPAAANKVILEELEGGAHGVVVEVEAPGQTGVKIRDAKDMARVLAGVHLEYAPVQLAAGIGGLEAARTFLAALPMLEAKPDGTVSRLNVDPLGTLAQFGATWAPHETALADTVKLAGEVRDAGLPLSTVLVDATVPHEAGASEAQELAFLACALVSYLRAFEAAGIAPDEAFPQIAFALAADTDLFVGTAKVRAARTIIARIAQACGASPKSLHITAVTSRRMMAKRDPWTNMLRTTAACASAAFGGADAISVLPHTYTLGEPDRFARRIARNAQLVLMEESSLGRVADPMGGSWYVEKLTDELADTAWSLFQATEAKGGLVATLSSGALQEEIAATAQIRAKAIATGRLELTGVSVFPRLGDEGVKVIERAQPAPVEGATEVTPLTPHRLAEPFEALRDASDAYLAKTGKRPRIFLASLGQIVEHNRRSTWVWNFLAAGGIEGLTSDGYADAAAAAAAFKESGADIACLSSSDEIYAAQGETAAKALKDAGAKQVLMAGRPGESEDALRAAGVDGFVYAGQDAIATLTDLQKALGVG